MFRKTLKNRLVSGAFAAALLSTTAGLTLSGCHATPAARPVATVPSPQLQKLAHALTQYWAQRRVLAPTLDDLVQADLLAGFTPDELDRYGYAGRPLGVLPDGGRVILVDDGKQADDSLWCVVQSTGAAGDAGRPTFDLVAVPLDTLAAVTR